MKKYILLLVLLGSMSSSCTTLEAQGLGVSVSINIGRQPAWGPVGYDYVEFYYFPDINCYFNVNLDLFYFLHGGRWVAANYLPYSYHSCDLYGMYKVVLVDVIEPWRHNNFHIRDYGRYKGYRSQPVIRDSREMRYSDSRNNKTVWYSDRNHDGRNNSHRNDNQISSGSKSNRQSNDKGNRSSQTADNRNYSNRDNNHSGNNSQKNINDNRGNNNERKDVNVKKQNSQENRQPQRSSENRSISGRNDDSGKRDSGAMRSGGSSGRSHGNEGRSSSGGERRGRSR